MKPLKEDLMESLDKEGFEVMKDKEKFLEKLKEKSKGKTPRGLERFEID